MGRRKQAEGSQRTWLVQVRFRPGNRAVMAQYVADLNIRLKAEGKRPVALSEWIRMLAWKTARPPGDTSSG